MSIEISTEMGVDEPRARLFGFGGKKAVVADGGALTFFGAPEVGRRSDPNITDEDKKVAEYISNLGMKDALQLIRNKNFDVPEDVLKAINAKKEIVTTDEGWNKVCSLVGKKSMIPYASERCTGKATIGTYGSQLRGELASRLEPAPTTEMSIESDAFDHEVGETDAFDDEADEPKARLFGFGGKKTVIAAGDADVQIAADYTNKHTKGPMGMMTIARQVSTGTMDPSVMFAFTTIAKDDAKWEKYCDIIGKGAWITTKSRCVSGLMGLRNSLRNM